ncbi:hypothetical protein QN277_025338 [Acacia crassicarpa]|uniref:Tropinone reductase I n=1 Tax=Acacia crassicarpa TaxID=499986 RepID=A0AAE1JGT6_9FABA|nr:hypothetical protein QN277_025338 [Acacia crassicarpa]
MAGGIRKDKRWSLSGMTALVTGATRGIGQAIVEELAEFGAVVHICSRNQEDIDKCLKEWKSKGFRVTGSVCDVSSRDQRQSLMETVGAIFHGKLNILINNAGTIDVKESVDHTAEDISTIMSTNFEATYHFSQLAHPLLKASGHGAIVNISSISTSKVLPGVSAYAASKGAINQITKYMAMEWAKDNIRVNAIASGTVMTLLLESSLKKSTMGDNAANIFASQIPAGRIAEPKEISGMAAFLCLPAASYITGQVICVDGGFTL